MGKLDRVAGSKVAWDYSPQNCQEVRLAAVELETKASLGNSALTLTSM